MSNRSIVAMPSLPLISASLDVGRITQHYEGETAYLKETKDHIAAIHERKARLRSANETMNTHATKNHTMQLSAMVQVSQVSIDYASESLKTKLSNLRSIFQQLKQHINDRNTHALTAI